MSKYKHITVYYPHEDANIADWAVGGYINELLSKGLQSVTIINGHQPHEGHTHGEPLLVDIDQPVTRVQGNVGSS